MRKLTNNSIFQYASIACLAFALMLSQVSKLHMHIEHDESLSSTTTEHKLNVHVASSLHDSAPDAHHQDDFQNNNQDHHLTDIKVTPDSVVKKVGSFNLYVFLFLFINFFLGIPKLRSVFREHLQTKLISTYYLLSPPLRAPPIHSPV